MTSVESRSGSFNIARDHSDLLMETSGCDDEHMSFDDGDRRKVFFEDDEEEDQDVDRDVDRASAVRSPRFEAYIMTGNVILSKTNLRNNQQQQAAAANRSFPGAHPNKSKNSAKKAQIVTPNIILRSPVLPTRNLSQSPTEASVDGKENKENHDEQQHVSKFEMSGHEEHQFTLTTEVVDGNFVKASIKSDEEPVAPALPTTHNLNPQLVPQLNPPAKDLYSDRSATPEIVDDRPVWTINSDLHKLSRVGPRFREILTEETIITDTTISEVTDTNSVETYFIQSPRTPRQTASQKSRGEFEGSMVVNEETVDRETIERNMGYKEEEESVDKVDGEREVEEKSGFVHPESARACMEVFALEGMPLDEALRMFLSDVRLVGETDARQRVVDLFAMRYKECNPISFYTRDSAFAMTSAMLILNSDVHSHNRPAQPPTVFRFLKSLREIPACDNVPDGEIQRIFASIKNKPLPFAGGSEDETPVEPNIPREISPHSGFLYRKCCVDPGGKSTRFGKRGWNKLFVSINDLFIELFKKQPQSESSLPFATIPLHHGFAAIASDYTKKKNVFRFVAVDESVCMFKAANEHDLLEWVVTLNRIAALYSAPVSLPVGSQTVGPSRTLASVKPMYPSRRSALSAVDQLADLKETELRLLKEIEGINRQQPQSTAEALALSRQLNMFKKELERSRIYISTLTETR